MRLSGVEGVNRLFEYELLLKTPESLNLGAAGAADCNLDRFIGREISCVIELDGAGRFVPGALGAAADRIGSGTRQINALITDARLWGEEGRHVQYQLTLRPWLHLATLSTDVKIFQIQTVAQILDELFADYPFPLDKRLIETYPIRDYQTQFNESDFEFFVRLTQENGISYFFEHSEGKHRLVLIDNMGGFQHNPSAAYRQMEYHPPSWKTDAEYIHSFAPHHQLTSRRVALRDYDYTRPRADLSISRKDPRATGQADGQTLRPALTQPKPRSGGPHTALVVGPEGQNLWTDAYGRIKVQFMWDRLGQKNQHSSCWVRVSSQWAGNQLGAMHIPRIGEEVLVTFIGGDPDLPICTGKVYNQGNLPPWALPDQAALSGFRSRELTQNGGNGAAGRSNHLILDDTDQKIQAQLKSDHQSSSLSLGHITRIDDHAGRKEARGEGFELATGGHGALRTEKGLLITTDGRSEAVGGMLSRDELVGCLEKALALAKDLGKAAVECQGLPRDIQPQRDLSQAVEALGHGANDEAHATGKALGGQPVLAFSGAAGIASATPKDHTQYAGHNIDTIAARNQQHYAGRSILQSASQDIEQFAIGGDIRVIANQGKVVQQAQHNTFEITAQKDVTISSSEQGVIVRADKSILLVTSDGTYLRLGDGKVVLGMKDQFIVKSAGRQFQGPSTLSIDLPHFPATAFNEAFVVKDGAGKAVENMKYRMTFADGGVLDGVTGADGVIPMQKGVGPDNLQIALLGVQR